MARADIPLDHAVPDVLAPNLDVVFCGINPGLRSAATGCHFAGPGNRFWPALHAAGFTGRQLDASEVATLPRYGIGITNLVTRTTARADELTKRELETGREALEEKMRRFRPAWLTVLGVTAYRAAFGQRNATLGLQTQTIGGTRVWLLPNPSGLNAHYQLADFVRHFSRLHDAIRSESDDSRTRRTRR